VRSILASVSEPVRAELPEQPEKLEKPYTPEPAKGGADIEAAANAAAEAEAEGKGEE